MMAHVFATAWHRLAPLRPPLALGLGIGIVSSAAPSCVYEADDACGPHQVLDTVYLRCVCAEGFAFTPEGCVACAENELPGAQGCSCVEGFARPRPESPCEPVPAGIGEPCGDASPCTDPTHAYCAQSLDGSGYCTKTGCSGSDDCEAGYACDSSVAPSFCRRPPVGQGQPCTSSEDCAGTEATYCDSFNSRSCLVEGCSLSANDCFAGWVCCDLSRFNVPQPICLQGACPP